MNSVQNDHQSRQAWLMALSTVLLIGSALLNIVAFASVSPVGSEIHALEMKTRALASQNRQYALEIARVQSLHSIKEQALLEGYIPITSLKVVDPASTALALQRQ